MKIKVQRIDSRAILPTKSYVSDAGWDLYSKEDAFIQTQSRATIDTGIAIDIPQGYVGLIWPRSGLAVKNGIDVLAGVIDSGYRDSIKVCLLNTTSHNTKDGSIFIKPGDRIAQILIQKVPYTYLEEVDELDHTERGMSGIGSTGS